MRMHNRGLCGNRSTEDIVSVSKVDDHDLVLFIDFLPNTYEVVGFES